MCRVPRALMGLVLVFALAAPTIASAQPANDDCSSATVVTTFPFTDVIDTTTATSDGADPQQSCSGFPETPMQNSNSVWYVVTAPAQGEILIDTFGSNYDTILTGEVGTCGSFTEHGCSDDYDFPTEDRNSKLDLIVSSGETLYFEITDFGSPAGGDLHVNVVFDPDCGNGFIDPNEDCDEGAANGTFGSCCSATCSFEPADTPCRDATGECDPADVCSGTSSECTDVKRTDVCRPSAGSCDPAESCDGVASDCPLDSLATTGTPCRPAAGSCDVAEVCTGLLPTCPPDLVLPSIIQCRAAAGGCDVAENCTGTSGACPPDAFAAPSVECRAAAGVCDVAEHCTGSAAACPADAKSTASCRPSAGVCDVAESCDGVGNGCPADAFVPSTVECRASAGVCDVAEHCTGSSASCPSDAFASTAVVCRASAATCDAAEHCTGASPSCPADVSEPDETPCDDANICSINDRCIGGVCGGFLENCGNGVVDGACAEECDDGNFDPGDGCDASCHLEPCGPAPITGCRALTAAGKATVQIVRKLNTEKNRVQWKYAPGAATPKADFGDPTTTTSYQFCIYEHAGGDPRLAASYAIPAGSNWKATAKGFKYTDKAHTSQGTAALTLKEGLAAGKTKFLLIGKGTNLPLPVLPLIQDPSVVMQLKASNGICWEATYDSPPVRNQPDQFRDK